MNNNNKNNKKIIVAVIILVTCILIAMIAIAQLDLAYEASNGKTVTYNFKPLIIARYILCAVFIVGLVTSIILGIVYSKKWKQISIEFQNKDYAFVVSNHALCNKLKRNKKVDYLYLAMAVSYLELGNNDEVLKVLANGVNFLHR